MTALTFHPELTDDPRIHRGNTQRADPRLTRVAIIGLGAMGSRIAARLLAAGHEVIGWARSPDRRRALAEIGVLPTTTPADAARRANVLITTVADPAALRAVTDRTDGVAAGAGTNLTVVEMSTVGPAAVVRLAWVLPAGVGLVDAPVLGSIAEAEAGSLTILAGGPAPLIERVTPLLSALGAVIEVGDVGAGAGTWSRSVHSRHVRVPVGHAARRAGGATPRGDRDPQLPPTLQVGPGA